MIRVGDDLFDEERLISCYTTGGFCFSPQGVIKSGAINCVGIIPAKSGRDLDQCSKLTEDLIYPARDARRIAGIFSLIHAQLIHEFQGTAIYNGCRKGMWHWKYLFFQ